MAKISVEFDTVEKTLACSMNGRALADVVGVQFGLGYSNKRDEYACEIVTGTESADDDMRTWTRICAADTEKGKALVAGGSSPAPVDGFVVVPTGTDEAAALAAEMAAFFGRGQK